MNLDQIRNSYDLADINNITLEECTHALILILAECPYNWIVYGSSDMLNADPYKPEKLQGKHGDLDIYVSNEERVFTYVIRELFNKFNNSIFIAQNAIHKTTTRILFQGKQILDITTLPLKVFETFIEESDKLDKSYKNGYKINSVIEVLNLSLFNITTNYPYNNDKEWDNTISIKYKKAMEQFKECLESSEFLITLSKQIGNKSPPENKVYSIRIPELFLNNRILSGIAALYIYAEKCRIPGFDVTFDNNSLVLNGPVINRPFCYFATHLISSEPIEYDHEFGHLPNIYVDPSTKGFKYLVNEAPCNFDYYRTTYTNTKNNKEFSVTLCEPSFIFYEMLLLLLFHSKDYVEKDKLLYHKHHVLSTLRDILLSPILNKSFIIKKGINTRYCNIGNKNVVMAKTIIMSTETEEELSDTYGIKKNRFKPFQIISGVIDIDNSAARTHSENSQWHIGIE